MPFLIAQLMQMPESNIVIFSRFILPLLADFLNQPQCNRLAKFLTWIRMLRMNRA